MASECAVCFGPIKFLEDKIPDNALSCANKHATCTACVRKLVKQCRCKRCCKGSGLSFTCPLCRCEASIDSVQVLAVIKDSYAEAVACMEGESDSEGDSESDSDAYPEVVPLDPPPEGIVCLGNDGVKIRIGDTVQRVDTPQDEFVVQTIVYVGFEDRSQAEAWNEPGYLIKDAFDLRHASEYRKVDLGVDS